MSHAFVERVQQNYKELSQGQRLVAEGLVKQPHLLAFGTAAEIGRKVGVSESTVIRLAHVLGYRGFPEMQAEAQGMLTPKLMPELVSRAASEFSDGTDVMGRVIEDDIQMLKVVLEENDRRSFSEAVSLLAGARHIYVTGSRYSYSVAHFCWYMLNFQLGRATFLHVGTPSFYTDLPGLTAESALLAIGFPRYSDSTLNIVRYAAEQGCPVVSITDNPLSPIGRLSKAVLTSPTDTVAAVMSYVPPLALVNALITGVVLRSKSEVDQRLARMEAVTDAWKEVSHGL